MKINRLFSIVYACEISRWLWVHTVKKKLGRKKGTKNRKQKQNECLSYREGNKIPQRKAICYQKIWRNFIWKQKPELKRKIPLINICVLCQFWWDKNNHFGNSDFVNTAGITLWLNLDYFEQKKAYYNFWLHLCFHQWIFYSSKKLIILFFNSKKKIHLILKNEKKQRK